MIDIVWPDLMCALEVDGPRHYLWSHEHRRLVPRQRTQMMRAIMRGLGWTVSHVPYYVWWSLSHAKKPNAQQRYLRLRVPIAAFRARKMHKK